MCSVLLSVDEVSHETNYYHNVHYYQLPISLYVFNMVIGVCSVYKKALEIGCVIIARDTYNSITRTSSYNHDVIVLA